MKKIICLFTILVLLTIPKTFSQAKRGDILLGGSSSFSLSSMNMKVEMDGNSEELGSGFIIEITPTIGMFLSDGFAIGLVSEITSESAKDPDDNKYTSTSIVIGPFLRYYFLPGNVKPFLHADVGYAIISEDDDGENSSMNGYGMDFGGGVAVYLNEKTAIEFGLQYGMGSVKDPDFDEVALKTSGINFTIGITVNL